MLNNIFENSTPRHNMAVNSLLVTACQLAFAGLSAAEAAESQGESVKNSSLNLVGLAGLFLVSGIIYGLFVMLARVTLGEGVARRMVFGNM